jgi:hypothetical protein
MYSIRTTAIWLVLSTLLLIGCRAAPSATPTSLPSPLPQTVPPTPAPEITWVTYTDWTTYRDSDLGFALQYPPHWQVFTLTQRPGAVYFGPGENNLLAGVRAVEGVTREETVENQVYTLEYRVGGELVERADDKINGYPGVRLVYRSGGIGPFTTWIVAHDERVYIIGATPETGDRSYDEMLATFHFLEDE